MYWFCKKDNWNRLADAKRVPSPRCAHNFTTSSLRLHQVLFISETKDTSSETSLEQYGTVTFSKWNKNLRYIGETVSIKASSMRLSLAHWPLPVETNSELFSIKVLFCLKTSYLFLQVQQRSCRGLSDNSLFQSVFWNCFFASCSD